MCFKREVYFIIFLKHLYANGEKLVKQSLISLFSALYLPTIHVWGNHRGGHDAAEKSVSRATVAMDTDHAVGRGSTPRGRAGGGHIQVSGLDHKYSPTQIFRKIYKTFLKMSAEDVEEVSMLKVQT